MSLSDRNSSSILDVLDKKRNAVNRESIDDYRDDVRSDADLHAPELALINSEKALAGVCAFHVDGPEACDAKKHGLHKPNDDDAALLHLVPQQRDGAQDDGDHPQRNAQLRKVPRRLGRKSRFVGLGFSHRYPRIVSQFFNHFSPRLNPQFRLVCSELSRRFPATLVKFPRPRDGNDRMGRDVLQAAFALNIFVWVYALHLMGLWG